MNTYLYAFENQEKIDIEKIMARSIKDCEAKVIRKYRNLYESLEEEYDFPTFQEEILDKEGILIGEIRELEEFV